MKAIPAFLLVFCFVLSPRFGHVVPIHTGFLALAILLVLQGKSLRRLGQQPEFAFTIVAVAVIGVYYFLLGVLYGHDIRDFVSILILIPISITFGWLFASYAQQRRIRISILSLATLATAANSAVILCEYASPSFKDFVEGLLYEAPDSNIDYLTHAFRFRGLASAGGATLSILMAVAAIIFYNQSRKPGARVPRLLLLTAIVAGANIFTGRTGLILSLPPLALIALRFVWTSLKEGRALAIAGAAATVCVVAYLSYNLIENLDPEIAGWAFEWATNLDSGGIESSSTDDLQTMLFLPGNPIHLLFGIGFFEGIPAYYQRSDSGYIKSILSIGIVGAAFLYTMLSAFIYRAFHDHAETRAVKWLLLAILLAVEVKEPFLYQNFTSRFLLACYGASLYYRAKQETPRPLAPPQQDGVPLHERATDAIR